MNKLLIATALAGLLSLTGCAGISQQDKAERQALIAKQQAQAKVQRANIALALATADWTKAGITLGTTAKNLDQAKDNLTLAEEHLVCVLNKDCENAQ
ncbi:hypothetical protein [Photobacterium leiognathi]|uniref:hypothetical protein n=1 Tax=Photobacterium leiognathi TaxID=553611 RepID=UPI002980BA99|nr:hypothetical protein [Photobacterium leiognathi]